MTAKPAQKRRIIGKNALAITLSGEKAGAAQIFNYDFIREIKMDLENLEVTVLLTYDESYHRVFDVDKSKLSPEQVEQVKAQVLKFYNDLITASMKFSKEEIETLQKQHEDRVKQMEEARKAAEAKKSVEVK